MTMNGTWAYKHFDHNWKNTPRLVRQLVETSSKGGNYLLNIGPKADGSIPQDSLDALREIGEWLSLYGESIYGTRASVIGKPDWGCSTTKDLKNNEMMIYLHIFMNPEKHQIKLDNLPGRVVSVRPIVAKGISINYSYQINDGELLINLPSRLWDSCASSIEPGQSSRVQGSPR